MKRRRHSLLRAGVGLLLAASTANLPAQIRQVPQDGDVSAILKRKTQEFSDAGQNGDGRTMGAALDQDVIFFNENGDRSTRDEMAAGGPPPPAGVRTRMTVEDWTCRVYGDVAVTSFVDDQVQDFHGQALHARFRSVETWLRKAGDWRMIGSQTVALFDDPTPAVLPSSRLDEYVGTYRAAADTVFVFSRKGGALMASANGGPATLQAAEILDVFFTPGRSRYRKLFQRDAAGHVVGFLYRHEGHDLVFTKV